ncbi:unnamed protein product, partial [Nippostrongylus brasiliensis]|uniref:PI3K/PI4K domain-containing protein n=1 Tax=Nippostrongylus brasiliensis TaxID=27835 RepID=A0A0N4YVZ2_NIPBR
ALEARLFRYEDVLVDPSQDRDQLLAGDWGYGRTEKRSRMCKQVHELRRTRSQMTRLPAAAVWRCRTFHDLLILVPALEQLCHPVQLWCVKWSNGSTVTRGCADVVLCPDEEDGQPRVLKETKQ